MQRPSVLILAAGRGERMQSDLPKVLHPLAERPLLSHVMKAAADLHPKRLFVVVGHQAARVRKVVRALGTEWVIQKKQRGTADAVLSAERVLKRLKGPLFVLYGDVPLISSGVLRRMMEVFEKERPSLVLLTANAEDPTGYGRILRNGTGEVVRIIEEREASFEEKKIPEVNTGICLGRVEDILEPLRRIRQASATREYYLTDLAEELVKEGKGVTTVSAHETDGWHGINSREDLIRAEEGLRRAINRRWMETGVTLKNPDSIFIGPEVVLDPGVVLHQGVVISGACRIGRGTEILPYSVIEESRIGRGCRIGPFAHLRPGNVVGDGAHVGNFVELKKTTLKRGVKANHLSYLGDAVIGEGTNVGAGTITCNYDGETGRKSRTVIGKNVSIGSDTMLVAPVRIGDWAMTGAGSVVTRNVSTGKVVVGAPAKETRRRQKRG